MSLLLDMVVGRVQKASPQEFREFAEALGKVLSYDQLYIVEMILAREQARAHMHMHTPPKGGDVCSAEEISPGANRPWGF